MEMWLARVRRCWNKSRPATHTAMYAEVTSAKGQAIVQSTRFPEAIRSQDPGDIAVAATRLALDCRADYDPM